MSELVLSQGDYDAAVRTFVDAGMEAAGFGNIEAAQQPDARVSRLGIAITAAVVSASLLVGGADKDASPVRGGAAVEQVMPGVSGFEAVDDQVESSDAAETLRMELAHYYENINPNRLVLGAENINWDVRTESRGANSFGFETFKTCFDVSDFLNSDSEASKKAQEYMLRNAENSDIDLHKELERAKKGEGFMAVQSLDQTVLKGTTYLVVGEDGKVHVERAEQRITPEGDVMWVYVTEDGKIIGDFSFRADCNQPGMDKVLPLPEDEEEEIPDVTTSTVPPTTTPPTTTPPTTTPPTTTPPTTTPPTTTPPTTTPPTTTPPTTTPPTTTPPTTTPPTTMPIHPPASGPPPEASQPGHTETAVPSDGYTPSNANNVIDRQNQETPGGLDRTDFSTEVPDSKEGGKAPGGGDESVVSTPGPEAPTSPDYQPGTESPGTKEGTNNKEETEGSDQVSGPGSNPGRP